MNPRTSPAARQEDSNGPSSPKRKKVRARYAAKACVSCRRSKLKCSGENPCQRCVDNGRRCFYSEDQTAAEALQNLSRPTPVPAPVALSTSNDGNGNGATRRPALPCDEGVERRASDASVGLSLEARMARIESMMESLMHERGSTVTPRISLERDEMSNQGLQAEFLMQIAGEAGIHSFPPIGQTDFKLESPSRTRQSISAVSPASSADATATIRVGTKTLPFPSPADYQKHLDVFFADTNPYYPCINEIEFRLGSERLLSAPAIQAEDLSLLALNYIVFACSEITVDTGAEQKLPDSLPNTQSKPPGWQWCQAADELVGKRKASGRADLCLIQYLVLEAVYLMYADKANAAYSIIGIACRLCFQSGLHQQSSWRTYTPFDIHMRQRVFWTVYFLDRRISLSCGRPYSIRESDIDVEQPAYLFDKEIHPDQPLPEPNLSLSSNMYLNCMVCWGRLAADAWDGLFAATVAKQGVAGENAFILDARVKEWTEMILPTIALLPPDCPPEPRQVRQHTIVHNSLEQLRLLLFRQVMVSLQYDGDLGHLCGVLALNIIQRLMEAHSEDTKQPSSFRFHMATSLGSALLILATLLTRNLYSLGMSEDDLISFIQGYHCAISMLRDLALVSAPARRILNDFADLEDLLDSVDISQPYPQQVPANVGEMLPYTSLDFAQQSGSVEAGVADRHGNGSSATATLNTDLWSSVFAVRGGKYGVPWI